ncbi:F-box protein At2g15640-like, partial [Capsella rubella]|uniref:F-box protein At2g15640-like n=1 Tax=Capsella rubella TaxID=81985 RepID=UPI000CD54358
MKSSCPISSTNDLILEIFSRLPSKSVARFRCLSKIWASMLGSLYFKELFLTRTSAKPRLLFAIVENDEVPGSNDVWSFFSLPQLEYPYEQSSLTSLVAAAEFHVNFSPKDLRIRYCYDPRYFSYGYASGLLYIYGHRCQARPVIYNPITGRYAILPRRYTYRKAYSFFGFDPIDKQHKALSKTYPGGPGRDKILTFGDGDMRWRKVKCSLVHDIESQGICINGVLYYLGVSKGYPNDDHVVTSDNVIICFDLRSKKFTFINVERFCELINYKEKLAMIYWEDDISDDTKDDTTNVLHLWVLKDVEKSEWSKHAYTLREDKFFRLDQVSIAGATTSGEILFSMSEYTPKEPFYVFYFNPERNTLQRVEIQGFGEIQGIVVHTFVNHVENLDVNDLKLLKSSHPLLVEPKDLGPSDSESSSEEEEDE